MSVIGNEYWLARIEAKKAQIAAYDLAITALATGAQSYRLNTGQTDQMVTKANLSSLRATLASLENDLSTLDARVCGAGFNMRHT